MQYSKAGISICEPNARLVAIAEGFHTYPSRTRPLSPPAPMVLGPKGPGRVGRRQAQEPLPIFGGGFLFYVLLLLYFLHDRIYTAATLTVFMTRIEQSLLLQWTQDFIMAYLCSNTPAAINSFGTKVQ